MTDVKRHENIVLRFVLYIWQMPQNIAGLAVLLYYRIKKISLEKCPDNIYITETFCAGGVSLGNYIFIHKKCDSEHTRRHELGHRVQSEILGPLYLPVIGIPSACLCIAARYSPKISERYYRYFPENWAEYLSRNIKFE